MNAIFYHGVDFKRRIFWHGFTCESFTRLTCKFLERLSQDAWLIYDFALKIKLYYFLRSNERSELIRLKKLWNWDKWHLPEFKAMSWWGKNEDYVSRQELWAWLIVVQTDSIHYTAELCATGAPVFHRGACYCGYGTYIHMYTQTYSHVYM